VGQPATAVGPTAHPRLGPSRAIRASAARSRVMWAMLPTRPTPTARTRLPVRWLRPRTAHARARQRKH